jgi:alpha-beta hydrolase superfamily lysophospholipase/SAM-dependent methyltransferase
MDALRAKVEHMTTATTAEAKPPARSAVERTMRLGDGTELFYRFWPAEPPSDKALVLFHRGHEHSGRFQDLVETLALDEVNLFAWDARGHGRSPGERGYAESFAVLVKDVDCFVRFISREHGVPIENMSVLGYSMAGVLVSAWVHDYAPAVRAMVLITPAFRVKLYIPLAIPVLRLWQALRGKAFVKSYVKGRMLTHDPAMAEAFACDELISRNIAVNILLDLHDMSTRLLADAGAIRVPTLLLAAGSDLVVRLSWERRFFDRLGAAVKQMETYKGFYHAILHERQRHRPIARIRDFVGEAFDGQLDSPSLLTVEPSQNARDGFDRLSRPLPPFSPQRLYYATAKTVLKTLGQLSTGIQIGWGRGFDSGESLDHIYRNRPAGITPLGRLIDFMYLNGPGWTAIRQRKINLQALLDRAIESVSAAERPVRVLDIASGPGRYLLETLRKWSNLDISAHLRDRDSGGLEAARRLAAEMTLTNVTIEQADAFDEQALAAIRPRPNVAVVSGLYELFSDNEMVSASLRGLAKTIEGEGYLIYTNQPWHPQLAFIARVLVNRDGDPWVMRCRSQAEIDQLVRAAGFQKIAMEIDDQGIFTVALAQKTPRS